MKRKNSTGFSAAIKFEFLSESSSTFMKRETLKPLDPLLPKILNSLKPNSKSSAFFYQNKLKNHKVTVMENVYMPNSLSLLPGFSHLFVRNKAASPVLGQLLFCILLSFGLGYLLIARFYTRGERSWSKAITLLRTVKTKIRRLENQREKWKNCLDMTEDTCKQYYALLHYVTKKSVDVSRLASYFDYMDSATNLRADSSKLRANLSDSDIRFRETGTEVEISEATY